MPPAPVTLTFFTRDDCGLCASAWFVVRRVAESTGADLVRVDIDAAAEAGWAARYGHDIPVVHLNGREIFRHRVNEKQLRGLVRAAQARVAE